MISFGALVAFSMVNLSVVKYFAIDRGRRRTARDILSFVVLPLVGFATTAWLWTSLSALTLLIGLAWAGAGLIYLLFVTRGFRRPTPQLYLKEV
jgi:amino acid transporter